MTGVADSAAKSKGSSDNSDTGGEEQHNHGPNRRSFASFSMAQALSMVRKRQEAQGRSEQKKEEVDEKALDEERKKKAREKRIRRRRNQRANRAKAKALADTVNEPDEARLSSQDEPSGDSADQSSETRGLKRACEDDEDSSSSKKSPVKKRRKSKAFKTHDINSTKPSNDGTPPPKVATRSNSLIPRALMLKRHTEKRDPN